jgi:hypothetical protein
VRQGLISAALCPSSEAEFRSRAAGPTALVGRGPPPLGRGRFERVLGLWIHLCFFFTKVNGFPSGFLGTLWLSSTLFYYIESFFNRYYMSYCGP